MSSGVNMLCFTASFGVAFALEAMGLWARPRWRRLAVVAAAFAGIVAQTWYLAEQAASSPWAPLSSQHDWCLAAAWGLAIVYLALVLYQPKASIGLFLLPIVLALIGAARFASKEPMAGAEMPRIWSILHGVFLMLGTVAVLLGFVAGLMYLVQSARLKNKAPLNDRFRLPSLEWLERVNARSLIAATILVGLGFVSGVLMRLALRDGSGLQWTDPVVLSLSGMFSWLVAAEAFRLAYPAARRGRKVAYLTLAGFVFLVITLSTFMSSKSMHGRGGENPASERQTIEQSLVPSPLRGWEQPSTGDPTSLERRAVEFAQRSGRGSNWVHAPCTSLITPPLTPPPQGEGSGGSLL